MYRKGISMPLNFIIIAALAIVVLVVAFSLIGGKANIFAEQTTKYCSDGKESREDVNCDADEVPVRRPDKNSQDTGDKEYVWCCEEV